MKCSMFFLGWLYSCVKARPKAIKKPFLKVSVASCCKKYFVFLFVFLMKLQSTRMKLCLLSLNDKRGTNWMVLLWGFIGMILNWSVIYGTILDKMQQTLAIFLFSVWATCISKRASKYVVRSGCFFKGCKARNLSHQVLIYVKAMIRKPTVLNDWSKLSKW